MNGNEVLRIVDAIHRDKNIDKDIVFEGIEQAILSAARKHFGEERDVTVDIDRQSGEPSLQCDGEDLTDILGDLLGRIAAQTAKQVMIQKIREAERDALFREYSAIRGQCVTGSIARFDGNSALVNLGKVEAILPRGEQIPGESHRINERVRAVIIEVKKGGSRVKVILSRTHPDLVLRLFEMEIPEVAEHVIEVRSLAREAGYRSKVAVSCIDPKIDCVGACVGVRGSRIRTIVDELAGERIDIVRWNDSLQVLVPNAMQPADVEDVILCPMLGRVIVLVRDDQLSLAIGKRGQNVRLASKLVGWDIEVMTRDELDEQLDKSVEAFASIPGVSEELAESLVAQGFFSFYDLSVIEPDQLAELGGLSAEECDQVVAFADQESIRQEQEEEDRRARAAREAAEAKASEQAAEVKDSEQAAEAEDSEQAAKAEGSEQVAEANDGKEAAEAEDGEQAVEVEDGEGAAEDSDAEEDIPTTTAEAVDAESDAIEQEAAATDSPDTLNADPDDSDSDSETDPSASETEAVPSEPCKATQDEKYEAESSDTLMTDQDDTGVGPDGSESEVAPSEATGVGKTPSGASDIDGQQSVEPSTSAEPTAGETVGS